MSVKTQALIKIGENLKLSRARCWLCGQPIDYRLPANDPEAFSIDHVKPQSTHPHLANEPSNCRASHARCNKARGNRPPPPGLGIASEVW